MKLNTLFLPMVLLAPALSAVEPTPWDKMTGAVASGTVTVTTNTGKKLKRTGSVAFTASAVTLVEAGVSVPRQEVKEVVIRRPRGDCCETLALGLLWPLVLLDGDTSPTDSVPRSIILAPLVLGLEAVTAPPLLIIEGVRRLKPTKVLYRVIP